MSYSSKVWLLLCPVVAFFCSCQEQNVLPANGAKAHVGMRNYSDAVVRLDQVDPLYRPYFVSQQGENFSLSEQRKAYLAAAETARTPVRDSDYRPADIVRKKAVAKTKKSLDKRSNARIATKGKTATNSKKRTASVAKAKTTASRR